MPEVKEDQIIFGKNVFNLLLSEESIRARVKELGKQISLDYKDKIPVFIGVLNGAFVFMADLLRNLSLECEVDFFKLSSYGDEKISSGKVSLVKELNCDVKGRDLVIVEDIIDSGLSIKFIKDMISLHNPASMRIAAFLHKPNSLRYNVKIDYIGFEIPSKFVIGYGLDYGQKYRNLKSVYIINEEPNFNKKGIK